MKNLILMLILLSCLAGCNESRNSNAIVYKPVSEAKNREAQQLLQSALQNPDQMTSISLPILFCGPFLTEELQGENIQGAPGKVKIPVYREGRLVQMVEMESMVLQDNSRITQMWETILENYLLSNAVIRKLNEDEKRVYWAMTPFDIVEPIFIVETHNFSLLVDFADDEGVYKIFYVDNLKETQLQ